MNLQSGDEVIAIAVMTRLPELPEGEEEGEPTNGQ
jgi:hypothetical protein